MKGFSHNLHTNIQIFFMWKLNVCLKLLTIIIETDFISALYNDFLKKFLQQVIRGGRFTNIACLNPPVLKIYNI